MGLLFTKIFQMVWGTQQARLCLLGLDAAGKTTILYKLKINENVVTIPTIGFNVETIELQNLSITVWDVGGQGVIRPLWRHYFDNNDGIIFVVDSSDDVRFEEARDELFGILQDDRLRHSPILVLANKQDLPTSCSTSDLVVKLQLQERLPRGQTWWIQATSAVTGEGLVEGIAWLAQKIKQKKG